MQINTFLAFVARLIKALIYVAALERAVDRVTAFKSCSARIFFAMVNKRALEITVGVFAFVSNWTCHYFVSAFVDIDTLIIAVKIFASKRRYSEYIII